MIKNIVVLVVLTVVFSLGFSNMAFAQGVQTSGGVNVEGTWYLGEGLQVGDYFEYSLCELDLNDCAPIKLQMWIKGEIPYETESLWDARVVIYDGDKIIKGSWGLGKSSPEPITFDDDLFDYAIAFKSSLAWLGAFATSVEGDRIHGPQKFSDPAWGKIGAIGGAQLVPVRTETISVPAGTVDTVVVGWYSGNYNHIWIVDDFPFPVKAETYAWVTTGIAPTMHKYTLLDFTENVVDDPFKDIVETVTKEKLFGCPTKFYDYTSGRVSPNTHTMTIQYNYAPAFPLEGCDIDWKINFMNKYNDVEFVDQLHYDIWVLDEDGNRLRSFAQELGRTELFNGFGQIHVLLPVKEEAGIVGYTIFIHGTGPEYEIADPTLGGFATIEIEIIENPLFEKTTEPEVISPPEVTTPQEIPNWIKTNAGWWADGSIDDASFVGGIQYLIENNIMKIPTTSQGSTGGSTEIPNWVKTNAGWWADGSIDDASFVGGIQYLIENGIMSISS